MKLPLTWLQDFVDLNGLSVIEVAHLLTMAGLEVEDIRFAGLPLPTSDDHGFKVSGLAWDKEKIVVAEIRAVNAHPNADRLTLCELFDGQTLHPSVLTGAPNLYPYKGLGALEKPLKVAYAKEGATLYDGHVEGQTLMTLKRAKIRGIESYSMVCSEKELGLSDEHEGIILLDDDAPPGMPLADYMGEAVLEVKINPNMARNANVLGLAREVAALSGRELKKPCYDLPVSGASIQGQINIEISDPSLNPRFTLGLIRNVTLAPSPYWVQRRLRAAGMRPISNVVDATNYAMLEIGEPLHAFDYDVLLERKGDAPTVTISTRSARPGEKLTTLDGVERALSASNVLVCDQKGVLSLAGVMGGAESEISDRTTNILLEAASWNFINIRRTANQHNLPSEASFRFSRGVHPALALEGLRRGLYWMSLWSGGQIAPGIIDNYPLPPSPTSVEISADDIRRSLGVEIALEKAKELLERLEFECAWAPPAPGPESKTTAPRLRISPPPFRLDIGAGVVGVADVMEEIARLYGYDHIPETLMADPLPPQRGNPRLEAEEHLRDTLVALGLQEIITHRMTAPENESRLLPPGLSIEVEYVKLANPIAPEKRVLRRSLLSATLNVVERNAQLRETLALFEVGPVYVPQPGQLPAEPRRLALALTGKRYASAWDVKVGLKLDFYDLKGLITALMETLHINVTYAPAEHPSFHPGKCASVLFNASPLGVFGELHPLVQENYNFAAPVLAAEFDLEALLAAQPTGYPIQPVSEFPPILEDIAIIVDEALPAERVEALIRQTGGKMLTSVRLFDVFRSDQIGVGKKSLAYALTYQSLEGTLTDKDAAGIRNRIVRRLENELGAKLRS